MSADTRTLAPAERHASFRLAIEALRRRDRVLAEELEGYVRELRNDAADSRAALTATLLRLADLEERLAELEAVR